METEGPCEDCEYEHGKFEDCPTCGLIYCEECWNSDMVISSPDYCHRCDPTRKRRRYTTVDCFPATDKELLNYICKTTGKTVLDWKREYLESCPLPCENCNKTKLDCQNLEEGLVCCCQNPNKCLLCLVQPE